MIPIAIVGMGAVFPGAGTARRFWQNIRSGVDAITDVPPQRWDPEIYYDPSAYTSGRSDRFYCCRGGFIDDLATFDPIAFGIMPAAVEGIEPDQLLALRTAAEAIADAGGDDRLPDRSRIGVVIGRGGYLTPGLARFDQRVRTSHQLVSVLRELVPDLAESRLAAVREAFCEQLGPDHPDASVGLVPNFAASRIADRFDLRGPAYTVDAACASALVAVEQAVEALRSGRCDAMLAGAVHHSHLATIWGLFSQLRALSPAGRIRPFDRSADGTLLSEGTGMVMLKRLADAERAGDRIYAVIRGVGCSSDGRAGSLMNPRAAGQLLALERAWRDAELDPTEPGAVGLVEAHGTATPVGDEVELETLRRIFGQDGPPIGLGAVKSMIGHAMPAGGMAGLIKTAWALHDGLLPPTLGIEEPHPALAGTRLRPIQALAAWETDHGVPRRAAVNAFGFGGANGHVVLEEPPRGGASPWPTARPEVLGDEDEMVLRLAANSVEELAGLLAVPDEELMAQADREPADLPCRLAVVAPSRRRLELARAIVGRGRPWRGRSDIWFSPRPLLVEGRLAFLFPGFEADFKPRVDDVAAHFGLPRPELADQTDLVGHAAEVIAVGRLLTQALRGLGIVPDVAAGHSLGEWTAMVVSGMYPPDGIDAFIAALGRIPFEIPDVVYAALGCGADRAERVIQGFDGVVVSHDNCPHQSVICGAQAMVRQVLSRLATEGVPGRELPIRTGFHTPMAGAYVEPMMARFAQVPILRPAVPVWSATTVAPFPEDPEEVRALTVRHLLEPVRFGPLVERLYESGVRAFVQVGPGSLPGFVRDCLGDRAHLSMAANVPERGGVAQLRRVAAALWAEGRHVGMPVEPRPRPGMRLDLGAPIIRVGGTVPQPVIHVGGTVPQSAVTGGETVLQTTVTGGTFSQPAVTGGTVSRPIRSGGEGGSRAVTPGGGPTSRPAVPSGGAAARSAVSGGGAASQSVIPGGGTMPSPVMPGLPELPNGSPVLAEMDALLRDATAAANTVLDALATSSHAPAPSYHPVSPVSPVSPHGPPQRPVRRTEYVTSRVFSLETMPYVLDHGVIPQRADWPDTTDRFPVVPLTTLLEVLAETARELLPGQVVIGFENVRALRWLVASPPTTAEIRARVLGPGRVAVRITGHTEGTVLLADHHPIPPAPDHPPLIGERPSEVTAERFYTERFMFHGPRYQGVAKISTVAADGVRGELVSLPTPGALLDSAGQLCGLWAQMNEERDRYIFPIGIERVSLHGPQPPEGERLKTTAWKRTVSDTVIAYDMELVRPDGSLWGRVDGWTTHRFHSDELVWSMSRAPQLNGISEPQPGGWYLVRKRWNGASSRDLLMRFYLCAAERAEYERLAVRAKGPWLLGRIVVKDAVRHWLWERGHGPIYPAEVTIRDAADGTHEAIGPYTEPLAVSFDHTAELAVALVRPVPESPGICLRALQDRAGGVAHAALTECERSLAGRLPGSRVESRSLDGHVVAWTGTDNSRESTTEPGESKNDS